MSAYGHPVASVLTMADPDSGKAGVFSRLDTVLLRVRDAAVARAWYEEKLGLTPVFEDEGDGLVVFGTGGTTSLTVWRWKPGERVASGPAAAFPIFLVEDAAATHDLLRGRGVKVEPLQDGGGTRFFTFYDPDGNRLEACQVL